MAVNTDFLLADHEQLASAFGGWVTVADDPVTKTVRNPFTGQEQEVRDWPLRDAIGSGKPAEVIDLCQFTHARLRRIDHVKLAKLSQIISELTYEQAIAELSKPALVHPTNEEVGLHQIPEPLVAALSSLSDDRLEDTARTWQQTEELQLDQFQVQDTVEVLEGLRAIVADRQDRQSMFLFWSL